MDPRHIETHAFPAPSDEERERPSMWRYWRALPPRGKLGIMFGSWYTSTIVRRAEREIKRSKFDQELDEINRFEAMLVNEGALIVKFWFHLSKQAQRKRLRALEENPETRWRVEKGDWRRFEAYDRYRDISEHALRHTSTGHAPWVVVEGSDNRYRSITVAQTLLEAMRKRTEQEKSTKRPAPVAGPPARTPSRDGRNVLSSLDMKQRVEKQEFDDQLERLQGRLNLLTRRPAFRERSVIAVFEGSDAAGKGGSIRRITAALDARHFNVIPIAAPSEEERAQPYLWRFWRHLPRSGRVTIFDRSWYGRVLVERVEKFCAEGDWLRAYAEINDFEEQLARNGAVVAKFWLAITADEQLKRFRDREKTQFKRFKITEEDWRNRGKWDDYERAVCDMIDRTSTQIAPWTLVEANDKNFARIKVLRTLCDRIEETL
jgi:polyphosphate:AMP phosphotransferase